MGAPSSELTGWLRRYSWSSRRSSVTMAHPIGQRRARPQLQPEKMQPRLVHHRQHLAEEHVNLALPLPDDRVKTQKLRQPEHDRLEDEHSRQTSPPIVISRLIT